uniref:Superoxide dismutase n=1 Tax=Minutocellus polymorphus TaxID=265543 RepID=A0A7S0AV34_9STRA|mmetsp:Transcript_3264/g.5609  ORF Transcript_3264/g.5609 Transcript_3264/m.5609 type:complete len:248 (+) Transcript_3264:70-813(+)
MRLLAVLLPLAVAHTSAETYQQPPLPFATNALEPVIGKQTLEIHHGKHEKKYVDTMNSMVKGTDLEGKPLDVIVKTAHKRGNQVLFNNAAQAWNHAFYFKCLSPPSAGGGSHWRKNGEDKTNEPDKDSQIFKAIKKSFGGFKPFRGMFVQAATTAFGSGWAWLCYDVKNDALLVTKTIGADNPMTDGLVPLLTIDVWEHAYYLNYQNKRPEYIDAFLDKLVNWDQVEKNLLEAISSTGGKSRLAAEL